MAKAAPIRDDSETPEVQELQRILAGSLGLHTACSVADRIGIQYYLGQVWATETAAGSMKPQAMDDESLAATANQVGPLVRHWAARLAVNEWAAQFEPGDEHPDTVVGSRQCQAWWNRFYPFARMTPWYQRLSFSRLVQCSAVGAWEFDDASPGGVRLRMMYPQRLTLDPGNASPDLGDHHDIVESVATSVPDLKRMFGKVLAARNIDPESEEELRNLAITEEYFGRTLYGMQPGAFQTETRGVLLHIWFSKEDTAKDGFPVYRRRVYLMNPKPKRLTPEDTPLPPTWHQLEDKVWRYPLPYVKLDCFPHPTCSWSRSLALELMPLQNALSIAHRTDVRAFVQSTLYKVVIQSGSIKNPEALSNNVRGAVVATLGGVAPPPQILSFPRIDAGAETIVARALTMLKSTSGIQDPMLGIPIRREMSAPSYQALIGQGLAPMEAVGQLDYDAMCDFVRRVARAAVMRAAAVSPRKFVRFVGRTRSNTGMLKQAAEALTASPTTCKLMRGAFLAETPAQIDARLRSELEAKLRVLSDPTARQQAFEDYQWERLFQTGYAAFAGQEQQLHNAEECVRLLLDRKITPEDIRQFDNHRLIKRVIDRLLGTRFMASRGDDPGLDDDDIDLLEQGRLLCEAHEFQQARRASAFNLLPSGQGGASAIPTAGSPAPGSAGESPAIAGAPGGDLAVAAG